MVDSTNICHIPLNLFPVQVWGMWMNYKHLILWNCVQARINPQLCTDPMAPLPTTHVGGDHLLHSGIQLSGLSSRAYDASRRYIQQGFGVRSLNTCFGLKQIDKCLFQRLICQRVEETLVDS